ncbi:MAG TPA: hypothetical protein VII75_06910 [Thermoanaerobaculia bacterium]
MRRIGFSLLVLILSSSALAASRVEEWNQDLDALETRLAAVHPKFKPCGLTPEVKAGFAHLRHDLEHLSDGEISVEVQRLLAEIGDGHTLLWPFGMKRGVLHRVPVMLWQFDDGLFVVQASDAKALRRRVNGIGGLPADEVLRRLRPYVSHDNDMQLQWAAPFYATITEFLVAIGAAKNATLTFDDGQSMTFTSAGIDPSKLELKLPVPNGNAPFRYEKRPDGTLYIQLNAIADGPDKSLATFGKELHSALAGVNRAVLDLRFNSGGDARKANDVLKTLIAFDAAGGKLAVLTSRMTFSAAQTLATRLDEWTNALFIGEATGSRPNHYGNERNFTLPNSGLRGTIASGINQPITANDDRETIRPDVEVKQTSEQYFRGVDAVLEAAVKALN